MDFFYFCNQQKSLVDRYTCCGKKIIQLLEWTFDWNYMVRGLVLDKKRGNILKVNAWYLTSHNNCWLFLIDC